MLRLSKFRKWLILIFFAVNMSTNAATLTIQDGTTISIDNAGKKTISFSNSFITENIVFETDGSVKLTQSFSGNTTSYLKDADGVLTQTQSNGDRVVYHTDGNSTHTITTPEGGVDTFTIENDIRPILDTMNVTSTSFSIAEEIPDRYSFSLLGQCDGENVSPQLSWTPGPNGTKSYLIEVFDLTAHFTHWFLYNIDSSKTSISEADTLIGSNGKTSWEGTENYQGGYGGPCPPNDGKRHDYKFSVFALDTIFTSAPSYDEYIAHKLEGGYTYGVKTYKASTSSDSSTPENTDQEIGLIAVSGAITNASIHHNLTRNGSSTTDTEFNINDQLGLTSTIVFDEKEIAQTVQIIVVALYNNAFYMKTESGWSAWDGVMENLRSLLSTTASSQYELVVLDSFSGLEGEFSLFVGYQNSSNDILYSIKPVLFTVNQ